MTGLPEPLGTLAPLAALFVLPQLILLYRTTRGSPLAERYPAVEPAAGAMRIRERVVFGRRFVMNWVRIEVDHAYLHVKMYYSPGAKGRFSVPLEDVTSQPDRYPWMIFDPDVVRLSFRRDPTHYMLVWSSAFRKIAAASGGRLASSPPLPPRASLRSGA
jgi:hypothetical protein